MIHASPETCALGTVKKAHADWDTSVDPTLAGYSGPLPWSPEMTPGAGQWSSVLSSKHRKPIWKQLTPALTAAWMSLSWNKHISGKAEVTAAGGRIQQGEINSVFSVPGAREPSHPDMQ